MLFRSAEPGSSLQAWLTAPVVDAHGYALVALIEGFLTADHGTTLAYDDAPGAPPQPRLGPPPAATLAAQWQQVHAACLAFARALVQSPAWQGEPGALSQALAAPLLALCRRPQRADALLLADWLFDSGRGRAHLQPLAPRLSVQDLARIAHARWQQRAEADIYLRGPWLRGSVATGHWPLRWLARGMLPTA